MAGRVGHIAACVLGPEKAYRTQDTEIGLIGRKCRTCVARKRTHTTFRILGPEKAYKTQDTEMGHRAQKYDIMVGKYRTHDILAYVTSCLLGS